MKTENIFDLQNLDDLPFNMKADVLRYSNNKRKETNLNKTILKLFQLKKILDINEITVALYRTTNKEIKRGTVASILSILNRSGMIKRIYAGTYEINNTENCGDDENEPRTT